MLGHLATFLAQRADLEDGVGKRAYGKAKIYEGDSDYVCVVGNDENAFRF